MKRTLLITTAMLLAGSAIAQRGYVRNKIEEGYEDKHGKSGMEKYEGWMNGKVLNVKTEPEYIFTTSVTMQVTDYKKGKKGEPTEMQYFLNPSKTYFGSSVIDKKKSKEEMFVIYELVNNYMLMLNVKEKTGMAISMNAFMSGKAIEERNKKLNSGDPKSSDNINCKKTGKTKSILGYSCEEYICTDEDKHTRSEFWITTKLPVDVSRAYLQSPYAMYFRNSGKMGGMMMEGNFYKNDELQSTMLVTDVNTSANRKEVMKEYKLNSGM
ncbi:MAG: DUF4412 domain-containing protein [Flavipsychrobacter sp.]|nr:DUF4412 domain-containing protein [Flavipsychrobacter sp.]